MKKNYNKALRKSLLVIGFLGGLFSFSYSQPSFNANNKVLQYGEAFSYGVNMGYYPNWTRQQLADIAAGNEAKGVKGAGINAFRPQMSEEHFEIYGYGHLLADFQYYKSIGIENNTVFLGYPASAHKNLQKYGGCSEPSKLFSHLYEPIWDGGENGTLVNENNYYATHVYKTVSTYKDYVKIWEIINEPDYCTTSSGWRKPGEEGNWWDNNPDPCELPNLKAPVFHYIRMLRISYEVIKQVDPSAFVAVGGIGYESFLDALLRNTDNPDGGKVTAEYPNKGGAYFDVLSYHCYPQYKLSEWDNSVGGFVYRRHSDAATAVLINSKNIYQDVLNKYGYNGATYPKKHFIITETNVPRKNIGDVLAGDDVQVNYIIKSLVKTQANSLKQFHVFNLGDAKDFSEVGNVYEAMGLYKNLNKASPFNQQYNDIGIAYKTTSDLLSPLKYSANLSRKLKLPSNIDGGVFSKGKKYMVVVWAKTSTDNSEAASATYSLPANLNISNVIKREWDFGITNRETNISPSNISLTGTPVFLEVILASKTTTNEIDEEDIVLFPNPAHNELNISTEASGAHILEVTIQDNYNRVVQSLSFQESSTMGSTAKLDISAIPAGLYTVIVETSEGQEVKKIYKK